MLVKFSAHFMADIRNSVETARKRDGIVSLITLAEELRKRNESENIALEDVELMVLKVAQRINAAMELNSGDAEELERSQNGAIELTLDDADLQRTSLQPPSDAVTIRSVESALLTPLH